MDALLDIPPVRLIIAALLAMPLAIDREKHTRIMGLRTFPLVAIGACGFMLTVVNVTGGLEGDLVARAVQGILSGVGFIGAGAILKGSREVRGTECAAGIWVTGAIGMAVALDQWWIACTLPVLTISFLIFLTPLKRNPEQDGVE